MKTWTYQTITLGYQRPPLTANQRMHWAKRARITRKVRADMAWRLKAVGLRRKPLEKGQKLRVQLVYIPGTNRRRDTDNLWPTLKAICDGIVDAGLVPDDTPEWMEKPEPKIGPVTPGLRHRIQVKLTVLAPN